MYQVFLMQKPDTVNRKNYSDFGIFNKRSKAVNTFLSYLLCETLPRRQAGLCFLCDSLWNSPASPAGGYFTKVHKEATKALKA